MIDYFVANEDPTTQQQMPFVVVSSKHPLCAHERKVSLKVGCRQAKQNPRCAALLPEDAKRHATHNRKDERRFLSNGFRNKQQKLQDAIRDVPKE